MSEQIEDVVLHEATRTRYLNYALSVITSRALPDIRDGLKPVQRRILFTMFQSLRLLPDGKHRKSAAIVGEVMGKLHPHGDQSIYDAMVRMAQDFALRYPLVEGQGNFGSIDGDNAAAMRYTEAKLQHIAVELLSELKKKTVPYRQNYDGTAFEPIVLPAQVPNLLVNGGTGIAVGMATNIPPHNLREVVGALIARIDTPDLPLERIVGKFIKGPDFPTGGEILNARSELREVYEKGRGAIDLRGQYVEETEGRTRHVIVTSIPYGVNKSKLITDIADHIRSGKLPLLTDVRDESTETIRIVLELKRNASAEAVMAYLYKRTDLQTRFNVNMTALLPTENPEVQRPERVGLLRVLDEFITFRREVTQRRLEFDLEQIESRIHLLRGFAIIFNALDEAIAIIRASSGKADARDKLMARFELDWEQAEAILETKLYRLAKLEIDDILAELKDKEARAADIKKTLASAELMMAMLRSELEDVRNAYGDRRRTKIVGPQDDIEFAEEVYIVAEDSHVIVTRGGWIKRQKSYTDVSSIRVREGDEVGWITPASTREGLIVFTDRGRAYTVRVADLMLTTGYGEAVQTRFDFKDGERIVGVATTDARSNPVPTDELLASLDDGDPPPPWVVSVTRAGRTVRMSLTAFAEPSNVSGRLYQRLDSKFKDDAVVDAFVTDGSEIVSLATRQGRCLLFPVRETKLLGGAGRGVTAVKLGRDDFVLGFCLTKHRMEGLNVETNRGRAEVIRPNKYTVTSRGNRGREIIRVGHIATVFREPIVWRWNGDEAPEPPDATDGTALAAPPNDNAPSAPEPPNLSDAASQASLFSDDQD